MITQESCDGFTFVTSLDFASQDEWYGLVYSSMSSGMRTPDLNRRCNNIKDERPVLLDQRESLICIHLRWSLEYR